MRFANVNCVVRINWINIKFYISNYFILKDVMNKFLFSELGLKKMEGN